MKPPKFQSKASQKAKQFFVVVLLLVINCDIWGVLQDTSSCLEPFQLFHMQLRYYRAVNLRATQFNWTNQFCGATDVELSEIDQKNNIKKIACSSWGGILTCVEGWKRDSQPCIIQTIGQRKRKIDGRAAVRFSIGYLDNAIRLFDWFGCLSSWDE